MFFSMFAFYMRQAIAFLWDCSYPRLEKKDREGEKKREHSAKQSWSFWEFSGNTRPSNLGLFWEFSSST
jgi:hypothetical protein